MADTTKLIERLNKRLTELKKKHNQMVTMYDQKTADQFYGPDIADLSETIDALSSIGNTLNKF